MAKKSSSSNISGTIFYNESTQAVAEQNLSFEVPLGEDGVEGFVVEVKRWVIRRTFDWLNFFR